MARAFRVGVSRVCVVSALVSGVLLPLLAIAPVAACSGGRLQVGDEPLEDAARAIFTGTVIRRDESFEWFGGSDYPMYDWTFVVDNVERGQVGERFTVASPQGSAACGIDFELGARYRVRAYDGLGASRLEVISGDAEPVPALASQPSLKGEFSSVSDPGVIVAILLPLLLVGLVVFTLHARRPGRSRE